MTRIGHPPQPNPHFGRVMLFIDGPNFYRGLLRSHKKSALKVNYASLAYLITHDNRSLVRAYFYDSHASGSAASSQSSKETTLSPEDRKALHEKIFNTANYELRLPDVDFKQQIGREEVDLRLAVDLIRYGAMGLYDVAVLITSDEDFVPAIRAVKEFGRQVELIYFEETARPRLINSSDQRRKIDSSLVSHIEQ